MNIFRQNTDYAIRVMLHLAAMHDKTQTVSVKTLSVAEKISEPFAAKIMQKLARAGLVESVMGVKGGFPPFAFAGKDNNARRRAGNAGPDYRKPLFATH